MCKLYFSENELKLLRPFYVYAYYDPDDDAIPFYIGKGNEQRAFAHLNDCLKKRGEKIAQCDIALEDGDELESEKIQKINEILDRNKKPRIDILARQLDEATAFAIEMAMIDCFTQKFLTNIQSGKEAEKCGRLTLDELQRLSNATPLTEGETQELAGKTLLLNVNKAFREFQKGHKHEHISPSYDEVYKMTWRAWRLNENRLKNIEKVCAVYIGQIIEIFDVSKELWAQDKEDPKRMALPSPDDARRPKHNADNDKYKGKLVCEYSSQNPVRYI